MWQPEVYKPLDRLFGTLQTCVKDFFKRDILVILKKCFGLLMSVPIERRINSASLNYALEIIISLPVTNKVDFFR